MKDLVARVRSDPEAFAEGVIQWSADKKALLNTLAMMERVLVTVALAVRWQPAPPAVSEPVTVPATTTGLDFDEADKELVAELMRWSAAVGREERRKSLEVHLDCEADRICDDPTEHGEAAWLWAAQFATNHQLWRDVGTREEVLAGIVERAAYLKSPQYRIDHPEPQ